MASRLDPPLSVGPKGRHSHTLPDPFSKGTCAPRRTGGQVRCLNGSLTLTLTGRPLHRSATEHMYMQVKDGLAGAGARVDDRAVSRLTMTRVICHARGDA